MPVRVLERGMLLHKCPLLVWEAVGSSHQAGGWEIRISSKVWLLMEGEWCWWAVVQPWRCSDIHVGAPQAPPEWGRRLWTAHAAAAGGIHVLPILFTHRCWWPVIAQASKSAKEQKGNLPNVTELISSLNNRFFVGFRLLQSCYFGNSSECLHCPDWRTVTRCRQRLLWTASQGLELPSSWSAGHEGNTFKYGAGERATSLWSETWERGGRG